MAASSTVPQDNPSRKSPIGRRGVLTLAGFGIKIRMQAGHLEIEDGIGPERRTIRLARIGHNLKRLVCVSEDGFATLAALKWISDVGASFVMLKRDGRVLFVTGPTAPSDARLRRAQCHALANGVGLEICRKLIDAKLEGQERLVRERLRESVAAQEIAAFRHKLKTADTAEAIRWLEAHAALTYFAALKNVPVLWPKADLSRIPEHWRTIGSRHSPLSGGPRLAVTPVHAILNFCFALLESETRLALAALGLDPGLGLGLHSDTPNRDSLALDVLEPVRPQIEQWLLGWVMRESLRRADFFETANGNCRLMSPFCSKLSETAPTWSRLVAPWSEYVAHRLWASRSSRAPHRRSTPLTQQYRREAKGRPSFPTIEPPKTDHVCRGCGKKLCRRDRYHCHNCHANVTRTHFNEGRKAAQRPESLAKRSATQRAHKKAIQTWNPSDLPTWLTRDVFVKHVQPALTSIPKARVRSVLRVSEPYGADIQSGKRVPHPRHWRPLAELVGVSEPGH